MSSKGDDARRQSLATPLGRMTACWTPRGLVRLAFDGKRTGRRDSGSDGDGQRRLAAELADYFRRGARGFGVPLDLSSGTEFQRAVWRALIGIPPGQTRTYGEIARAVGRPRAARAVGNACNRNPVAIVVPCHRVVAADGIGGFGSGLAIKRRLLELEGADVR